MADDPALLRFTNEPENLPLEKPLGCARCGYDVRGLSRNGRCPECALEIVQSIGYPFRAGTAWLRRMSFFSIALAFYLPLSAVLCFLAAGFFGTLGGMISVFLLLTSWIPLCVAFAERAARGINNVESKHPPTARYALLLCGIALLLSMLTGDVGIIILLYGIGCANIGICYAAATIERVTSQTMNHGTRMVGYHLGITAGVAVPVLCAAVCLLAALASGESAARFLDALLPIMLYLLGAFALILMLVLLAMFTMGTLQFAKFCREHMIRTLPGEFS